jgi:hypothetical protein
LIARVPEFPTKKMKLRVRQGFVDPRQWAQLRTKLRSDFRDAADFAFLCGAREMEILSLKWADVEPDARVIHLRETKTGRPRAIPYADWPEMAAIIERRAAVREQLKRAAVFPLWVFCFSAPITVHGRQYHAAGGQLFKTTGQRGLPAVLRDEWAAPCEGAGWPVATFTICAIGRAQFRARGLGAQRGDEARRLDRQDYSRYAIGAENEIAPAVPALSEYMQLAGLHFGDTAAKTRRKSKGLWRRGEGVEPSGKRIARQAGFEDRWGHRAPSSSIRVSAHVSVDVPAHDRLAKPSA